MDRSIRSKYRWTRLAALGLAIALVCAACGGGSDDDGGSSSGNGSGGGEADAGKPVPGGKVTYGLEAENSNGWCLPEGQLAISGIMVARTIYDTLTQPNDKGEYKGFLAKSVESDPTYTQWTIKLREGVKFHDGSALDSTVVKNNLDAYRGKYPGRSALLFSITLGDIADVQATDPMTVTVTTKRPWPALPSYLFGSGRMGIMAQAQLDDKETCDTKLIGTGPFKLEEWKVNDHLSAVKNPDYWQKDSDGQQLPYLDEIEFRPIIEPGARYAALQSNDINMEHDTVAATVGQMRTAADAGEINLVASDRYAEVAYGMFNLSKAPFDNIIARKAVAAAFDPEAYNQVRNEGLFKMASGPFADGEPGYLEDAGMPKHDPDEAKKLVQQYEQETGKPLEFTISSVTDAEVVKNVQFLAEEGTKAGMKVTTKTIEQAALISTALAGDFQAISWRNHPGGEPDGQYVWWYTGYPTNFGHISDPEIDKLLDEGRGEADPAKKQAIYENINKVFGEKVYNLWLNWTEWNIASATDVHGVYGPDLPDGGGKPFDGLATGHQVSGLWISKN